MMKNLILTLIVLALAFNLANAVPASPRPMYIQQSDGSTLTLFLKGDEFCHYFATEDNVPVVEKPDNSYYYAQVENGSLIPSDVLAHNPMVRLKDEVGFIEANKHKVFNHLDGLRSNSVRLQFKSQANQRESQRAKANTTATTNDDVRFHHVGQKKMLIILVEFPDKAMKYSRDEFDDQYNMVGYSQHDHYGSVHDFFYDQSYGNFDLTFDIVGPFVAKEKMRHYGQNNYTGNDQYVGELVTEAVLQADEFVDFNDYDWDDDGEVDQVFIVYAGYGESSGASSNTIWPHQYYLSYCSYYGDGEGPVTLDGVVIDKYACASELCDYKGSKLDGIGTFCHEFSHCLGLPDFYDTAGINAIGMSYWDLLDAGCYNGPQMIGEVPAGYSAYERWKCGWLEYIELAKSTRIEQMPCLLDAPVAYKINCDQSDHEYLILENRQSRDWYSYVGYSTDCHGMLVTHVDYKKSAWEGNTVNNTAKHQRMSFIPADNDFSFYTADAFEGDLFPGLQQVTELNAQSHSTVGGKWFGGSSKPKYDFDKYLLNIVEDGELISFDFYYDLIVPVPNLTFIALESENCLKVQWDATDKVDFYEIEISQDIESDNDSQSGDDTESGEDPQTGDDTESGEDPQTGDDTESGNESESVDGNQSGNESETGDNTTSGEDPENGNELESGDNTDSGNDIEAFDEQESEPVFTLTKTVVEGNECVFEDLPQGKYKIRMRASYLETYSDWTDYITLTITSPNGILSIVPDRQEPVCIYNLQGIKLEQISSEGVYLFCYPNRTVKRYIRL